MFIVIIFCLDYLILWQWSEEGYIYHFIIGLMKNIIDHVKERFKAKRYVADVTWQEVKKCYVLHSFWVHHRALLSHIQFYTILQCSESKKGVREHGVFTSELAWSSTTRQDLQYCIGNESYFIQIVFSFHCINIVYYFSDKRKPLV